MNQIPVLNFQAFISQDLTTDSLKVSAVHNKRHDNVVSLARKRIAESGEFGLLNFKEVAYVDAKGESRPMFTMTKNGYAFLVGKMTGKKAVEHQVAFINAFDQMARYVKNQREGLVFEHFKLELEHKGKKAKASICGRGLADWKNEKPVIETALQSIADKMNPPLPFYEAA